VSSSNSPYPDGVLLLSASLALAGYVIAALAGPKVLERASPQLMVTNFRGRHVPAVGGVVVAIGLLGAQGLFAFFAEFYSADRVPRASIPGAASLAFLSDNHAALTILVLGFFVLGAFDDLSGNGRARGLAGHLKALLQGQLTTGIIKAAGGLTLSFLVSLSLGRAIGHAVLDALLISGTANLVNLFDLRPGRACKVFLIGWLSLAAANPAFLTISSPVAGPLAAWLPMDLGERGTLGDSGANLIGAVLGAGISLTLAVPAKVLLLLVVLSLTLASERYSFTGIIERVGPLRWFDGLGRRSA